MQDPYPGSRQQPLLTGAAALQAQELDPDDPTSGYMLQDLGFWVGARQQPLLTGAAALQAQELDPDDPTSGYMLQDLGFWVGARQQPLLTGAAALQAQELDPDDPTSGYMLQDLGFWVGARQQPLLTGAAALQAQELDPDDPTSGYMLQAGARLCKCLGDEFLPYLGLVMPPLLAAAQLKPDVHITDAGSDADEADDDEEVRALMPVDWISQGWSGGSGDSGLSARDPSIAAASAQQVAMMQYAAVLSLLQHDGHQHLLSTLCVPSCGALLQQPEVSTCVLRSRQYTWGTAKSASAPACWRRRRRRATCCAAMRTS